MAFFQQETELNSHYFFCSLPHLVPNVQCNGWHVSDQIYMYTYCIVPSQLSYTSKEQLGGLRLFNKYHVVLCLFILVLADCTGRGLCSARGPGRGLEGQSTAQLLKGGGTYWSWALHKLHPRVGVGVQGVVQHCTTRSSEFN